MRKVILVLMILCVAVPAMAQPTIPRASQSASVTQTIGTTKITIDYHRPGVKGREIWGGLVPFDKPWRMGANEATTITFTDPVKIEGKEVPAGTYSFFAVPGKEKWTLILNKDPKQWGAYGYDASKDQVRVEIAPVAASATEWMRFTIDPTTPNSALVTLNWEKVAVPMKVDVDVSKIVWANVDAALASAKPDNAAVYGTAAAWALDSGERVDEGLVWVDKAIAAKEDIFNLWTKARLLQKKGRSKEALPTIEKAIAMAGSMPEDFRNILNGTLKSIKADLK